MALCPCCHQPLPASEEEEVDPGFQVASPDPAANLSSDARYDQIRAEIEAARKNLADGGWRRLYKALTDLRSLAGRLPVLSDWNAVCQVIFDQPSNYVLRVLEAWAATEALAEIGFDEKLLRGDEAAIDRKVSYAGKEDFNIWRTRRAIQSYRHYQQWKWCKHSI